MKHVRLLFVGLALVACTRFETEEQTQFVYDPYEGPPAYPNRRPKFVLPAGDVGFVSNNGSDTVSVLSLTKKKVLGTAPIGRDPVENDGPHHLAIDRDAGFVYVALAYPPLAIAPGPHAAHGSSQRTGFVQKLAPGDLRIVGEVRVDTNPGDIVLSEDGKRIVVSHFDLQKAIDPRLSAEEKRATLAVIDPKQLLPRASPEPVRITTCVAPHGVVLARPSGSVAYVACYGEDAIGVVDLDDPKHPVERIPVGPGAGSPGQPSYGPYSVVMSSAGDLVAVGNTESKDVRFFDVAGKAMSGITIKTQGAPFFPAWSKDDAFLFVPTQAPDQLVVADAHTGQMTELHTFGDECIKPHEVVFSTDESTLYVVCEGDHRSPGAVLALDPETLETKATFEVGIYPDRLVIWGVQ